jgi:hypothetical protein
MTRRQDAGGVLAHLLYSDAASTNVPLGIEGLHTNDGGPQGTID